MVKYGSMALGAGVLAALVLTAGCHREHRAHHGESQTTTSSSDTSTSSTAANQPSDAADTGDATTFLQGLYDREKGGKNAAPQIFGADEAQVFDVKTLALLKRDKALLKGQPSALKGDWLCDCQDPSGEQATISVQSANPEVGVANVSLQGANTAQVGLDLTKLHGAWRIHDIRLSQGRRLRKVLIEEVKRLKTGGAETAPDNPAL